MATKVKSNKAVSKTRLTHRRKKVAARAFLVNRKAVDYKTQLADLRKKLGISQKVFAQLSSTSQRAVARWEAGEKPGDLAKRTLVELQRLYRALSEVMEKTFISEWLETPNKAFGGLKPVEVIERGEMDRVWSMIYYLKSGEPI